MPWGAERIADARVRSLNGANLVNIRSYPWIPHRKVRNKRRAYWVSPANTKARGIPKRKGELRMKTTLWVTTAAAALIAGATFAGAQTGKSEGGAGSGAGQMSQGQGSAQKGAASEQKGAEQKGAQKGAEQKGAEQKGTKPGTAQGKEERTEKKGAEGKAERSTQAGEKAQGPKAQQGKQPGMAQEKGGAQTGQSTTGQQKPSTQTQTQGTSKGTTSGSTSSTTSTSVQLSQEQRTKVHSIVVKESSARVDSVDFSVSVGTVVPRHIRLVTLPTEVVEIVPQFRGFKFIIVRDEILIIDPNTFKIVAVIPA